MLLAVKHIVVFPGDFSVCPSNRAAHGFAGLSYCEGPRFDRFSSDLEHLFKRIFVHFGGDDRISEISHYGSRLAVKRSGEFQMSLRPVGLDDIDHIAESATGHRRDGEMMALKRRRRIEGGLSDVKNPRANEWVRRIG